MVIIMDYNKQVITIDGYKGFIKSKNGDEYLIYLYELESIHTYYRKEFEYIRI